MTDFKTWDFHLPTRIAFGVGVFKKLCRLPEVKSKRCMLLAFPGFNKSQLVVELTEACSFFHDVEAFQENPGYEFVQKLSSQVVAEEIDTIIAIGGGSSIDTAKGAAWMAVNSENTEVSSNQPIRPKAQVVAVPTTSGTGSEITPYAILTDETTHRKKILSHEWLYPVVAVCDPALTVSMPRQVSCNTGVDALSHGIEAWLSKSCEGFMEAIARSCCNRVRRWLPVALKEPKNFDARSEMSQAALEGGVVLAQCGTVMVHALGYCLTSKFGYAHGRSNGILLAGLVERLAAKGSERAKEILDIFEGDLGGFIETCGIEQKLPAGSVVDDTLLEGWTEKGYQSYGRGQCVLSLEREDIRMILQRVI